MTNLQFLPPCEIQIPGTGTRVSLTPYIVIPTTAGAIGALGARLVTHLSPKLVGGLFALAALITGISATAFLSLEKPEREEAKALLAAATGGLCGAILCHKTVVPLTVTSALMFPILTTVATFCGFFFSYLIVKDFKL